MTNIRHITEVIVSIKIRISVTEKLETVHPTIVGGIIETYW